MAKQPLIDFDASATWTNKHHNVSVTAGRLYTVTNRWADGTQPPTATRFVAGLRALQQIVRDAESANKRVRAFGGGWSLSSVATTEDYLINTRLLSYINIGFKEANVSPRYRGNRHRLVFAQCGTSVMELNRELERRGLSLPTSGASNGQTIVGATATGTHGSNRKVGAMHDCLVGLHVIGEGGKAYWIERQRRPVVTEAFARSLGAQLVCDERLFWSAAVAFGSFGLVHGVLLEAVPLFTLEKYVTRMDYAKVRPALSTLDVSTLGLARGAQVPEHFEVVINPYGTKRGAKGATVRYMYQHARRPPPSSTHGGVSSTFGDDVMGLMGGVTTAAPGLIPVIAGEVIKQIEEGGPWEASLGHTFGVTTTEGYVMSTEIGVRQADAERAVEAILSVADSFRWPGLIALRYVKGSWAPLAFTRFSPVTCTIELPSAGSSRTLDAFERIWDELERRRIPYALHWGQQLRYDPPRVKRAFGVRATRWQKARQAFLTPRARHTFSNALLDSTGLAT